MNGSMTSGIVLDGLVIASAALVSVVVLASWLAALRAPRSPPVGSSRWFRLPSWAQVGAGFGAVALFAYLGYRLWIPLPLRLPPPMISALRIAGLAAFLVGSALVLGARLSLGSMYGVSTSSAAQLRVSHKLIRRGPYARVRHPMYLGYWLLFAGALLIYRTWTPLALLAMFVPAFYRRARREEAALAQRFGGEWDAYAARVPMFIPRWHSRTG